MELNELQRMTTPKLRDLAKESTDLQGVGGMHKEDLVKAIAKAKGIAYDESVKDLNAIHSVKQDIRVLQKQKAGARPGFLMNISFRQLTSSAHLASLAI